MTRQLASEGDPLHRRANLLGHIFIVAIAEQLRLAALAGSDLQDFFEYLLALGRDRHTVEYVAAIDVHVVDHALIDRRVGGELDRGRWLATIGGAAAGGE